MLSQVRLSRIFNGPDITVQGRDLRFRLVADTAVGGGESILERRSTQSACSSTAASARRSMTTPLPTDQFALGMPFRLSAYNTGELRGPHYYVATGGYLRQVGRLPDFMGGPVFAGGWLENGDAFDKWSRAGWRTNGGVGVVMDTLVGPVMVAGSWGFDGRWRTYIGVGRGTSAELSASYRSPIAEPMADRRSSSIVYVPFLHFPTDSGLPASSCVVSVSSVPSTCQWRGRLVASGPVPDGGWPSMT